MTALANVRFFALVAALGMAGCSGGGSDAPAPPANRAPVANALAPQQADEFSTVTLDGGQSSDPDGDTLAFNWEQTAGQTVTLTGSNTARPTFTAPDVFAASPEALSFRLTVSDGLLSANDSVSVTIVDVGLGANNPPVARAGSDRSVAELTAVTLDGSASSDPDGDPITFSWLQTAGPIVTLAGANGAQPTFTAPDVAPGATVTLTFELTVGDGTDTGSDSVNVRVSESLSSVSVSGRLTYEFPPPTAQCRDLNFNAIQLRPVRGATVQLIDAASSAVLGQTVADDDGNYAFSDIDANTDVRVRVRAELKRQGAPGWDVEVRDNVDTSANPPPLGTRPLYVVQFPVFNTGGFNVDDADFTAATGWDTTTRSYTGTRAAAPLAILDQVYTGIRAILAERPTAVFDPLDAFWSVNNTLTSPTDIDAGELSASFYQSNLSSLFLLGNASVDTEEFDDHVVMHEWGHYFEDKFSRSDSRGGPHTIGQSLDARLAFGEGWATALAAIVLENQLYCDTGVVGGNTGFGLSTESENRGSQGWMNEMSVATLIYDLWDTNIDGVDTGSIGFGPILDVMTGPQVATDAFTTLFSFGNALRSQLGGADLALLDALLTAENTVTADIDDWGTSQDQILAAPNQNRDVLPLYTDLPVNGTTINVCANSDYDSGRDGNKLAEYRYLRITTTASRRYTVTIRTTTPTPPTADPDDRDQSDPDMFIFRQGQLVAVGNGPNDNEEIFTTQTLPADTYVADLQEWRFEDEEGAPDSYPEQICFDVTMSPL